LHQGDPLLPYLFLLVADALSELLHRAVQVHTISPVKVSRRASGVSHLLFADASLLFFKASEEEARNVKEVLGKFCSATGQLINNAKCSLFFASNTSQDVIQSVATVLQTSQMSFESKYLGLPTPTGRMKYERFHCWLQDQNF
jgi:hypothetical protein